MKKKFGKRNLRSWSSRLSLHSWSYFCCSLEATRWSFCNFLFRKLVLSAYWWIRRELEWPYQIIAVEPGVAPLKLMFPWFYAKTLHLLHANLFVNVECFVEELVRGIYPQGGRMQSYSWTENRLSTAVWRRVAGVIRAEGERHDFVQGRFAWFEDLAWSFRPRFRLALLNLAKGLHFH